MKTRTLAVLAVLALALAGPASADLLSYMTINGGTQGPILGDSTVAGREDQIPVTEYHHLIERPAGQSIQHQTVIVTLEFGDRSIPNLMTAMAADEQLGVLIDFYRPDGQGAEEKYVSIQLIGAKVVAIEPLSPRSDDPDLVNFKASVRVRFSYTAIEHLHRPTSNSITL